MVTFGEAIQPCNLTQQGEKKKKSILIHILNVLLSSQDINNESA